MSRAAQTTFRQRDITKAIKAAVKAGVKDWRVEIDRDGKISVVPAAPATAPQDPNVNEWDTVK
jgi:hypothetical protein